MKTAPESRKIATMLKSLRDRTLHPQPDFQRRAVWTTVDKIAFIETILMGYPFPEIYIASGDVNTLTGEAVELLVDGQQRVRTIDEYFRGVAPFARTQAITRYANLEEEQKRSFLNYDVSVRNLGIVDINQIRVVFQRMNATSYDLNDMERYNAVYLGEYKKFCERIAQDDFFLDHRIFSAADIRRMKDTSFVASMAATMMSDYFHRDDDVETFLEQYNENFPEAAELEGRFRAIFALMDAMNLERTSRAWKKADFYTLFVELDRMVHRQRVAINPAELSPKISEFFREVDGIRGGDVAPDGAVGDYFQATLQSTNDRSARVARGRALQSVISRQPD